MTVYVDDMYKVPMGRFRAGKRTMKMSHMIADTEAELHAMAEAIGVQRKWFQQCPSGNHYDISLSKRVLAITAGAKEITMRQCAAICGCQRRGVAYASPADAWEKHRGHLSALMNAISEHNTADPATPTQGTLPLQSNASGE